jgi:hypothetical protein
MTTLKVERETGTLGPVSYYVDDNPVDRTTYMNAWHLLIERGLDEQERPRT